MTTDVWPDTPTVLQGAYACDVAPAPDGGVFGAWAGERLGRRGVVRAAHVSPGRALAVRTGSWRA